MLKNTLFGLFLIILGIIAGVHSQTGQQKYKNYNGQVKDYNDARHPLKLCKNALNVKHAKWVDFQDDKNSCSKPIKCSTIGGDREIILEQKPEDGVVCYSFWTAWEWNFKACISGKCVQLEPNYPKNSPPEEFL